MWYCLRGQAKSGASLISKHFGWLEVLLVIGGVFPVNNQLSSGMFLNVNVTGKVLFWELTSQYMC